MKTLTDADRKRLWRQVEAEFPDDRVMQDVHFARLVHAEMLCDEPTEACTAFFQREAASAIQKPPNDQARNRSTRK